MPELPEAESNRRRIETGALNRTIERVLLGNDTKHVELPGPDARERLVGRQFSEARRYGKYVFAGSKDGPWLVIHLGMAGSVRVYDEEDGRPDYARLVVEFEGTRRLAFRDPRKFGWVKVVEDPSEEIGRRGLGPDALSSGRDEFADAVGASRGAMKSALLDQKKLAGVGNLWADETLYRSGIAPDAVARDLSGDEITSVHTAMGEVLNGVCDTNADYSKLPNGWLIHRREEDAACGRCDGKIGKAKVSGRTTYFCTAHQGTT